MVLATDIRCLTIMTPTMLFSTELDIRWGDLDAFNHVNNAVHLVYIQEARLRWLTTLPPGWHDDTVQPVVVNANSNYRRPIQWPARIRVELGLVRLGQRSVTLGHRIVDAEDPDRVYGDGHVVMVWTALATGEAVPVPSVIVDALKPEFRHSP